MDGTGIDGQLLIRATAAAGLAKTAVDIIRTQQALPSWVSPLSAFLFSIVIIGLISEVSGTPINTRQNAAGVILGGFIALPMAIGATALQSAIERRSADQRVAEVADINVERAARRAAENVADSVTAATGTGGSVQTEITVDMLEAAARRGAESVIEALRARSAS